MIRRGVVATFKKTYGFIRPDDGGKQVFFHLTDRRAVVLREEAVVLGGEPKSTGLAVPQAGDRVVFEATESRKGPRALWAFTTPYDIAQGHLDKMPFSRVVKMVTVLGAGPDTTLPPEVVWTGKNHGQVTERFPELKKGPVHGRLFGARTRAAYRLETQEDGQWPNDAADPSSPADRTPLIA